MKKLLSLFLILMIVPSFAACTAEKAPATGDPEKVTGVDYVEKPAEKANEASKVGEEEVRIYIPEDYLYSSVQSISDDAKSKGAYNVTVYEDGAVAYLMSRSDYDKMMSDNRTAFEGNIASLLEEYSRIFSDVKYNDDFSHMDLYADSEKYTQSGDTQLQETLFAGSRMFQMYLGKDPKSIKMTYNIYDKTTGELIESATFPDDLSHE